MGASGHTAPGEELNVSTGGLRCDRQRHPDGLHDDHGTAPNTNRTIAIASYRVDLQNAKDSAVVVEVREDHGGEWSIVELGAGASAPPPARSSR